MAALKYLYLFVFIHMIQLIISCEYNSSQEWNHFPICSFNLTNSSCIELILSNEVQNNIEISFSSQESFYHVSNNLSFHNQVGLHLISRSGVAKIICTASIGISFTNITNLHLEQLNISGCGNEHQNGGVTIINCTHVTITRVTIEKSWRTGLALLNTGGVVVIQNCSFFANGLNNQQYTIPGISNDRHGKGGGLQLIISNNQTGSVYNITNCTFRNNTATEGGGMCLVIHEGAQHNNVYIKDTLFERNKCENSGGGLNIEYVKRTKEYILIEYNSVLVRECCFYKNMAKYGGGTAFLSSRGLVNNNIAFNECKWEKNTASFGIAVDISVASWEKLLEDQYLPSPLFVNCVFAQNIPFDPYLSSASTLAITGFRVQFSGTITFESNSGSCIEATATILAFRAQSNVLFQENHGFRGAAIAMRGLSTIQFQDNSIFKFSKNRASETGGAIYVEYAEKYTTFWSTKCFLQYIGKNKLPKNATFKFEHNIAGQKTTTQGDSIYVTHVTSCIMECILPFTNHSHAVPDNKKCLGDFVFVESSPERKQISTSAKYFVPSFLSKEGCGDVVDSNDDSGLLNKTGAIHFIPGKPQNLTINLVNDLEYEMPFEVSVKVTTKNSSIHLDPAHLLLTSSLLTLFGKPNETACVRFLTLGIQKFHLSFKVLMDECPPGYVYSNISNKCVCSVNNKYYKQIRTCYHSEFQAAIQYGSWIGHENNTKRSNLASAICPKGFCKLQYDERPSSHTKLPPNTSTDISTFVCNEGRKGVVCGSCKENRSAYYNSDYFKCGSNDLCHLGWLFYILSELVPVTILFLIIIVFNISFTSGALNGVIFFMQIVSTVRIQANGFIWLHPNVYPLKQIHQFIYFVFDLNFFHIGNNISFCLWEDATALDILAFRYVTILYSLVLVVVTVFLLRQCNCSIFGKSLPTFKGSIIHGLSAFLVMSYSVCTKVSLSILTPVTLHIGPDYRNNPQYDKVVYYNGDYSYFGPEHLRYAFPAIFFVITFTIIPPLLLLSYPLCYKLFALLGIDESKFVQITCKIIPLEKIKPFFDSVQGAFKDRYRFFAGLYFVYRFACIISFALSDTLTKHYTLTGIFLALMLAAQGAFRPYKKVWQNLLEASLFFNLFVINAIASYNYILLMYQNKVNLVLLIAIQNVLILLPLLYLVSYIVYRLIVNIRSLCRHQQLSQETSNDSDDLLNALDKRDSDNHAVDMIEYKLM